MAEREGERAPVPRRYSEEEAREILNRAAGLDLHRERFSRDHLREMAAELGISESQLVAAERAYLAERDQPPDERQLFIRERRREFRAEIVRYVAVIAFLWIINAMTSPDFWWVVFPAAGWGLGIVMNSQRLLATEGEQFERAYDRWQKKRLARQQRRERLAG